MERNVRRLTMNTIPMKFFVDTATDEVHRRLIFFLLVVAAIVGDLKLALGEIHYVSLFVRAVTSDSKARRVAKVSLFVSRSTIQFCVPERDWQICLFATFAFSNMCFHMQR